MSHRIPVFVLLVLALAPASAHALDVHHARTPQAPPGAPVMAGYLVLINTQPEPVSVTGASSPFFDRVEFHRSVEEDGTTRMIKLETVEVPAAGRVEFVPRGRHLMLFGPLETAQPGQRIPIELSTSDGPVEAELVVVERGEVGRAGDHGH